jgi:uncharacterized protein YqeY
VAATIAIAPATAAASAARQAIPSRGGRGLADERFDVVVVMLAGRRIVHVIGSQWPPAATGAWMRYTQGVMSMLADVNARITRAMKAHDAPTLSALRMLKTALTNKEVEKGRTLEPGEALQVVATLVKQRRDSIEQFQKGGRPDLVDKEQFELALLEGMMPPPAGVAEIEEAVARAVLETGATSLKDTGRVMKAAMAALAGKPVDGKAVNEAVRRKLSG